MKNVRDAAPAPRPAKRGRVTRVQVTLPATEAPQRKTMDRVETIARSLQDATPSPHMTWPTDQYRIESSGGQLLVERYERNTDQWVLSLAYPASEYRVEKQPDRWALFKRDRNEDAPRDPETGKPIMDKAARHLANNPKLKATLDQQAETKGWFQRLRERNGWRA